MRRGEEGRPEVDENFLMQNKTANAGDDADYVIPPGTSDFADVSECGVGRARVYH
jgi:hypothetical protein